MSSDATNLQPTPNAQAGLAGESARAEPIFDSLYQSLVEQQNLPTDQSADQVGTDDDKRDTDRRTYECQQFIAEFDGYKLPPQSEFRLVMCHDISSYGFSYWSPTRPDAKELIVILGGIPFIFMHARVASVRKDAHSSYRGWRIGCEFVKRVGI